MAKEGPCDLCFEVGPVVVPRSRGKSRKIPRARLCRRCDQYRRHILRIYGEHLANHLGTLREQRGVCPICGLVLIPPEIAFDHDHKTGVFRGWLCRTCNSGLGHFRDDVRLLALAQDYLNATGNRKGGEKLVFGEH